MNHYYVYVYFILFLSMLAVCRKLGKVLEEGASGFLEKKISCSDGIEGLEKTSDVNWSSLNKIFSASAESTFGTSQWASVYLASTPQQAAELGINFPGADEVRCNLFAIIKLLKL